MHSKYPRTFSPIQLGPIEIPNRFFFSPHGVQLTVAGKPSNDYVHYQAARAKGGGAGLIICSMTATDRARDAQPTPYPEENIPSFRALAHAVHGAGAKIFGQIWYHWITTGHWQSFSPRAPAMSASAVQFGLADRTSSTHEMSRDEIRAVVAAFRQSTRHLREAGFDGVMLHASHGGMIEQFLSPYFNRRTDEYGGGLENRMRFLVECLEAAREGGEDKLAVGIRLNCDELVSGGYDTAHTREVLRRLSGAGLIDYVDLDVAIEPNQLHYGMPPVFMEPQVYKPFVEAVRSAAGDVPVMSVLGRVTSMRDAEAVIESGLCDMVGAARALIAEPEFVQNAFHGREERSRTCIACNWCMMSLSEGAQGCTINPASYRERLWGNETLTAALRRSKVVVVGAGPAGLEAARVSALKGHDVTLYEARDRLGGALALWASLPGREFFYRSIEWWERELERLGVRIRKGIAASADLVLQERPDAVIVATGARYSVGGNSAFLDQPISGHDRSFVHRPEEILLGHAKPSGRIVLLDAEGLNTSVGIAEILARDGAEVEYVTASFSPVSPRLISNQEFRFIMKRLRAHRVRISPATYIKRIDDGEVVLYDVYSEEERTIKNVSAVVLSTSRVPVNALAKELEGKVSQLFPVGDALAARLLANATYEGQKFARYVGEPDAPSSFCEAFFSSNPPTFAPLPADTMKAVNV